MPAGIGDGGAAAQGDAEANTALKIVKRASTYAQKYRGK